MRDFLLGKRHRVLNDNGLLINVKKFLFFEAKLMEIFVAPSDSGAISQESFEEKAHFTQVRSKHFMSLFRFFILFLIDIAGGFSNAAWDGHQPT